MGARMSEFDLVFTARDDVAVAGPPLWGEGGAKRRERGEAFLRSLIKGGWAKCC